MLEPRSGAGHIRGPGESGEHGQAHRGVAAHRCGRRWGDICIEETHVRWLVGWSDLPFVLPFCLPPFSIFAPIPTLCFVFPRSVMALQHRLASPREGLAVS